MISYNFRDFAFHTLKHLRNSVEFYAVQNFFYSVCFTLHFSSLEQQLQVTKQQLQVRQTEREHRQRNTNPSSATSPATTSVGGATTTSSGKRESSAPPAPMWRTGDERGREDGDGHQGTAQREQMEQRVREELFNDPLQTSPPHAFPHTTTASTTAAGSGSSSVVSFHNSYHGETAEQLRNRARTAWDGSTQRFNSTGVTSYTGIGSTTSSANRSAYPPVYPPTGIQSSTLPHFVPSPSPASPSATPQIPAVTPSPSLHHQSVSQEWTEYTSAPSDGSQCSVPLSPPPHINQESSSTPDVSEFDPIQS